MTLHACPVRAGQPCLAHASPWCHAEACLSPPLRVHLSGTQAVQWSRTRHIQQTRSQQRWQRSCSNKQRISSLCTRCCQRAQYCHVRPQLWERAHRATQNHMHTSTHTQPHLNDGLNPALMSAVCTVSMKNPPTSPDTIRGGLFCRHTYTYIHTHTHRQTRDNPRVSGSCIGSSLSKLAKEGLKDGPVSSTQAIVPTTLSRVPAACEGAQA